jgi:hypothetical protein
MAMISNFSYEKNILNLAKQLLAEANYGSVSQLLAHYVKEIKRDFVLEDLLGKRIL